MRYLSGPVATLTVAVLASLGFAAPASAGCLNGVYDEPPPLTSITPGAQTSFEQTDVRQVQFTLISPLHGAFFLVLVASTPALGQTGILSDLDQLNDIPLLESQTNFGYYHGASTSTGYSLNDWTDVPGTYYWQLYGWGSDALGNCHMYAGPINTITVTPSPPLQTTPPPQAAVPQTPTPSSPPRSSSSPSITVAQAPRYATQMVRARTGRRPRIRLGCSIAGASAIACALRWGAGGSSYLASGAFIHRAGPGNTWTWSYDFRGVRAWRLCAGRRRCSDRSARFHWIGRL